jgi:hypothetical protein
MEITALGIRSSFRDGGRVTVRNVSERAQIRTPSETRRVSRRTGAATRGFGNGKGIRSRAKEFHLSGRPGLQAQQANFRTCTELGQTKQVKP